MRLRKTLGAVIVGALLFTAAPAVPAQAHGNAHDVAGSDLGIRLHSSGKGWCAKVQVPVAAAEGQARNWLVLADYCQPYRWGHGQREVDVLTHGATYTHTYWDWEQEPRKYSYVAKTLADGRATLAYDRIGNGQSSRPVSSTEITMASDAFVLHQLVRGLKFLGYKQVNSISHSYGSGVALAEATTYADVSSLVLSGYLHRPSNPAVTAGNYPANQDAKFASLGLDNGYLTSRPGVRGASFHAPTTDPAVVAYDDDHKDLVSLTGLLGFLSARGVPPGDNISNLVKVPVLVINGQLDAIFCYSPAVFDCTIEAAVTANEAPFYAGASDFKVVAEPGAGHDLTLHQSAGSSYQKISDWIRSH